MDQQDRLFAEIAVRLKLMTREQVAICVREQAAEPGQSLGDLAVERGMIGEGDRQAVLGQQARILEKRRLEREAAGEDTSPGDAKPADAAPGGWANPSSPQSAKAVGTGGGAGGGWANMAAPPTAPGGGGGGGGGGGWANMAAPPSATGGASVADVGEATGKATADAVPDSDTGAAAGGGWANPGSPAAPDMAPQSAPGGPPPPPPPRARQEGGPPPPPPPTAGAAEASAAAPAQGDAGGGSVVQSLKAPLQRPRVETPPGQDGYIVQLLRMAVQHRASDLHLHSGAQVLARIDGRLRPMSSGKPLSAKAAYKVIAEFLTDEQWRRLAIHGETDFAYEIPGTARFRVNVYRQHRGLDIVFRVIPFQVPTLEQLGLPDHLHRLTDYRTGLVLCTGPAGCGKSSTLAALVNGVIQRKTDHVITVEDPIEFVYPDGQCVVNQRQVRKHTESYDRALRAALREDPDIIVIAELRDLETISLAMSAAETGHLVLGTLHTANAAQTVNRLVSVFPADEQGAVRTMLAGSLRAVVSQRLVPRINAPGRALALELLMVNAAVGNMIRDNKIQLLPSAMQTGKAAGMVTLDDSLHQLVRSAQISPEDAMWNAVKKERFGGKS